MRRKRRYTGARHVDDDSALIVTHAIDALAALRTPYWLGDAARPGQPHAAVMARPGQTSYGLVHYTCSIEEAVATEYSDDEMPMYRRWKPSARGATG